MTDELCPNVAKHDIRDSLFIENRLCSSNDCFSGDATKFPDKRKLCKSVTNDQIPGVSKVEKKSAPTECSSLGAISIGIIGSLG